ncbi:MAG TPA: VanZ family protein [Planktothrix sp.]|jgi:VanZ family protein
MSSLVNRLALVRSDKKYAWTAVALWMLVIFAFSAQAHSGDITAQVLHDFNYIGRKAAHMCEYAILFLLCRNAAKLTWARHPSLIAFAITVLYSMSDEYHQSFVPGRTATINDVIYDSCGALAAWLVISIWLRLRQ